MGKLVLLNHQVHRNLRVRPELVEAHGAGERLVPVVLSEFPRLAIHYPIVVTKNSETGSFVCVSVFGFEQGENLFWVDNSWDAAYIPLNVARQPFFIGNDPVAQEGNKPQEDNYVICIDSDSEALHETKGELLFDDSGKETLYLEKMNAILATLLEGEQLTRAFLQKLLTLDLLVPVSLDITFDNGEKQRVEGSYTIDENRLQSLTKDVVGELHALGYLGPMYTMVMSLGQFYPMINRKKTMLARGGDWFRHASDT